jgi:hypothetical protein
MPASYGSRVGFSINKITGDGVAGFTVDIHHAGSDGGAR